MKLRHALSAIGLLLVSHSASAVLIEANDPDYGTGNNITWDTQTGLEWLDLTVTQGCDIYKISAKKCNGFDFADWTLASKLQVSEFWGNAGISSLGSFSTADYAAVTALLDNIGYTYSNNQGRGANGIIAETTFTNPVLGQLSLNNAGQSQEQFFKFPNNLILTTVSNNRAAYFIRQSQREYVADVPNPSSGLLMMIGVLGLLALSRAQQRRAR
ncbi:MAG: hypothetical protein OEW58_04520 [Gammaproteobacteria bacterium]|nr:hypothetical protein [Gammaproteobacteria bacterium]